MPRRSPLSASQALDYRKPPHLPASTWVWGLQTLGFLFAHQVLYPQRHPIRPSYLVFLKKALLMVLLRPDLTSNLLSPFRIKRGFCLVYSPGWLAAIGLQTQITFRLRGRWQSPSPGFLSLKKLQDIREHGGSCGSHYSTLQPPHSNSAPQITQLVYVMDVCRT